MVFSISSSTPSNLIGFTGKELPDFPQYPQCCRKGTQKLRGEKKWAIKTCNLGKSKLIIYFKKTISI